MLIHEVTNHLKRYDATVRVKQGGSSTTVKTQVKADGLSQARAMLSHIYGASNVLSVSSA